MDPVAAALDQATARIRREEINPVRRFTPVAGEVGQALNMVVTNTSVIEWRLRCQHGGNGPVATAGAAPSANMAR